MSKCHCDYQMAPPRDLPLYLWAKAERNKDCPKHGDAQECDR